MKPVIVMAAHYRQALLHVGNLGYRIGDCRVVLREEHLLGLDLRHREVWWVCGQWPDSTHEDIARWQRMYARAKTYGADIRHWYT